MDMKKTNEPEDTAPRPRLHKEHFAICVNELLNMLRLAGAQGESMDSILEKLKQIPCDEDEKKPDEASVARMFAVLKKHGCDYRFDYSRNRYILYESTWKMPVQIELSSLDQIALLLGWDALLESVDSTNAEHPYLKKSYSRTIDKLNASPYSSVVGNFKLGLKITSGKTDANEKTFLDLSFALETAKPLSLALDGTLGFYRVKKLVLESSGWFVSLADANEPNENTPSDSELVEISRITRTQLIY